MAGWSDVTRIMASLGTAARTAGRREWRVNGRLAAWERPLRQNDRAALGERAPRGDVLAVYVPLEVKEALLGQRPRYLFTTPHFDGWPCWWSWRRLRPAR